MNPKQLQKNIKQAKSFYFIVFIVFQFSSLINQVYKILNSDCILTQMYTNVYFKMWSWSFKTFY